LILSDTHEQEPPVKEPTARLPRPAPRSAAPTVPAWASVADRYYADSFDASSPDALAEAAGDFAALSPDEQVFHSAHIGFRQVQGLADVHAALLRIEKGLARLDPNAIAALQHLPSIRKALVVLARGQQEMLDVLDAQSGASLRGDADDDDEEKDGDAADMDGDDDAEDVFDVAAQLKRAEAEDAPAPRPARVNPSPAIETTDADEPAIQVAPGVEVLPARGRRRT
jgi:hypothetical protein